MAYDTFAPYRRQKRMSVSGKVFVLFIAPALLAALFFFFFKPTSGVVSPIPQKRMFAISLPFIAAKKNPDELEKLILDTDQAKLGRYSVIVKDLHSDFLMSINPDEMFTGASVNKLPILGVLYYLVQKGEIDVDRKITLQEGDIQDYGTGSIRYDPLGTTYSIRTLARLMIQKSDNTAAYILGRHVIGMEKIQTIIDSWGMAQTDMEQNTTLNTDMSLLMEKIYREKIANKTLTSEMLSFLNGGTIEDRIPARLPEGTVMYHKTGNGVGFLHDVGIVAGPKTTYYIGLFTKGVPNEEEAVGALATLSRIVYDFMK